MPTPAFLDDIEILEHSGAKWTLEVSREAKNLRDHGFSMELLPLRDGKKVGGWGHVVLTETDDGRRSVTVSGDIAPGYVGTINEFRVEDFAPWSEAASMGLRLFAEHWEFRNDPTGRHAHRAELEALVKAAVEGMEYEHGGFRLRMTPDFARAIAENAVAAIEGRVA